MGCGHCLRNEPAWDRIVIIGHYLEPLSSLIHRFKFQKQFWLDRSLSRLLYLADVYKRQSLLPELFPTHARYSGASLTYNISGLFGASVAAIIALPLNANYGLKGVGIYLTLNAVLSLIGLWFITETRDRQLL